MKPIFVTVAALVSAGLLSACGGGRDSDRFLTETVVVGDIENTVIGTGVLQPRSVIDVGAQASGQIESLNVEVGDVVSRGDLIAVIDPETQQNTLRQAQAAMTQALAQQASQEASLERAELELGRQQQLIDQGYTSQAAYDRAQADVKVAQAQLRSIAAQIEQAQVNVQNAQVDLGRTNIYAPIDGVVATVVAREGQTVNAVQTAPTIVRLAQLDVMTVRAQISEADVIGLRPGLPVYFTILGAPDTRYEGSLRAIEPAPENATANLTGQPNQPVYYSAVFDVPNLDGELRSGMTAEVNVVLGEARNVLTMPSGGLTDPNGDGTYTVRVLGPNDRIEEREVRVGINNNVVAEVLSGLEDGDVVVIGDSWDVEVTGLPQPGQGGN